MPLKSLIGDNMRLQLQRLSPPPPILTAFILLTSIPFLGRRPSASISTIATTLTNSLMTRAKHGRGLTNVLNALVKALTTTCLRIRIHVYIPLSLRRVLETMGRTRRRSPQDDSTYPTRRAEAKYWRIAGRYRLRLYSAESARSSRASSDIPLVTYYTPRLLPLYRGSERRHAISRQVDVEERRISPRTFCKWHRMVFRGSHHPTLAQAAVRIKYYSNQDLREMQRIARLLPDEQVFRVRGGVKWTNKYRNMWRKWLANKEVDLVIVFADD